jgi:exoribonuclease-2
LYEFHRTGAAFPSHPAPRAAPELPLASVEAFSLDDIGTTEIDDAFSVTRTGEHDWRVGIHIAAPALVIEPGDALEAIARERLSSAYFPGQKYTMLPPDWISALSLDAGTERPAVSLYLDFSTRTSRSARVIPGSSACALPPTCATPSSRQLNRAFVAGERVGVAYEEELRLLWQFAEALERARGKPSTNQGAHDYVFRVTDGSSADRAPLARRAARQARFRADDRRKRHLGRIPRRARRSRDLPRAVIRQSAD